MLKGYQRSLRAAIAAVNYLHPSQELSRVDFRGSSTLLCLRGFVAFGGEITRLRVLLHWVLVERQDNHAPTEKTFCK